jgi:BlaI family transcriptional regulator, penicillinase repressor
MITVPVEGSLMKLTKFELEVMDALWELKSGSVREIQESLPEKRRPAYTTVQTIIYRLEEKGAVRKAKKVGNAYVFEPSLSRKSAYRRLIDDLLETFGGSTRPLMAHLIESGHLTLDTIRELEDELIKFEQGVKAGGETGPELAKTEAPARGRRRR